MLGGGVDTAYSHTLFTGGKDATIRFWDLRSGVCLKICLHSQTCSFPRVHPIRTFDSCSHTLFTGGKDAMIRFWDLRSGLCLKGWPETSGLGRRPYSTRPWTDLWTRSHRSLRSSHRSLRRSWMPWTRANRRVGVDPGCPGHVRVKPLTRGHGLTGASGVHTGLTLKTCFSCCRRQGRHDPILGLTLWSLPQDSQRSVGRSDQSRPRPEWGTSALFQVRVDIYIYVYIYI